MAAAPGACPRCLWEARGLRGLPLRREGALAAKKRLAGSGETRYAVSSRSPKARELRPGGGSRTSPATHRAQVASVKNRYDQILGLLSAYMSPLIARSTLDRALAKHSLSRRALSDDNIVLIVGHLAHAARLFVEPRHLAELRAELEGLSGEARAPETVVIEVGGENDIVRARAAARTTCETLRASAFSVQKVSTIVSELARNIVNYAGRGSIRIEAIGGAPPRVMIVAEDEGPGIKNLKTVLAGKYRSKTGLGLGIVGSKRLADRFEVESNDRGTRVEAEVAV